MKSQAPYNPSAVTFSSATPLILYRIHTIHFLPKEQIILKKSRNLEYEN